MSGNQKLDSRQETGKKIQEIGEGNPVLSRDRKQETRDRQETADRGQEMGDSA